MELIEEETKIDLFENFMENRLETLEEQLDSIKIDDTTKPIVKEPIECIICFEDIETPPEHYRFICEHKDNMHEHCIKELDICPICRKISLEKAFSIIDEPYNDSSSQESVVFENISPRAQSYRMRYRAKIIILSWVIILFTVFLAIFLSSI